MKYCCQCATELIQGKPEPDRVERKLCPECGYIAYENPTILVSAMMHYGDRLLWLRRDCEPRRGYWGVPAGFMECNETLPQAAARELFEETGVVIDPSQLSLYAIGSISYTNEIYVAFRGEMSSADFKAGDEAQEVALFSAEEMPWQDLAFGAVENYIRDYYRELKEGKFGLYLGDFDEHKKITDNILPALIRQNQG
ncbi:ADP-ribose pyrophosphatase YjhB (NUDIX family) [Sinobacterium caligoides]|uniref:ADP-ribose pyrophosphatase YjhB (NUDIX family) n=1 Tax=Sinobacterium caligoides TaxID=933926 RepID=A0A3N2DPY5_9GAMM|nr:NUDIX hydrolase [Sinobacterium caligoides]ROS01876.1 ADP-ribose pyrophosphatase YjhB (NUDIX family) [Sinobacterium caligoides]